MPKNCGRWLSGYCPLFVMWCLVVGILPGCASLKETAKGIAGVSTKEIEKGRKTAVAKTFNYSRLDCYAKTLGILKKLEAYVYAAPANKEMIAIYVSDRDTTPVGIFFKEIDPMNTQVEVSSPSAYAKELISKKLFLMLENKAIPEEQEAGKDKDAKK